MTPTQRERKRAADRRYSLSPKGRARDARYNATDKGRARRERWLNDLTPWGVVRDARGRETVLTVGRHRRMLRSQRDEARKRRLSLERRGAEIGWSAADIAAIREIVMRWLGA